MINQEELNNKVKEINKPFKEHNRIINLSENDLRDEILGLGIVPIIKSEELIKVENRIREEKKQTGFSDLGHYEGEEENE